MKFLNSRPVGIAVGVLAAGAVLFFLSRRASAAVADAVSSAGDAINPVNNDNIFARGADAVGASITGDSGFSIGGALFDFFNPELANFDPNAPTSDNDSIQEIDFGSLPLRRIDTVKTTQE